MIVQPEPHELSRTVDVPTSLRIVTEEKAAYSYGERTIFHVQNASTLEAIFTSTSGTERRATAAFAAHGSIMRQNISSHFEQARCLRLGVDHDLSGQTDSGNASPTTMTNWGNG